MVSIFFATQGHFVVLIFSFRHKRASSYSGVQGRLCLFGQVNISIYGLFKINKKFRIHITIYSDRIPKFIEQEFYWLSSKFFNLRCQKPKRSFKTVFSARKDSLLLKILFYQGFRDPIMDFDKKQHKEQSKNIGIKSPIL